VASCANAQPKRDDAPSAAPTASAANAEPAGAQDAASANATASAPLERFLANVDTLTADFEQRAYSPAGGLIERSSGTMALDRPGRFRWHFARPDEALFLADGESFKMYEFDLEQLTIKRADDVAANPLSILSGDGDFDDVFAIVDRYGGDGLDWIALEPVSGTSEFRKLAIGFDGEMPRRIDYVDPTDATIRIELTNLSVNTELSAELFEFEPPEGATVLSGN
jgi:outer membrane lipoprotein carrier protein